MDEKKKYEEALRRQEEFGEKLIEHRGKIFLAILVIFLGLMYDETNEKLIEKIIEETKIEEIRKCKSNILNEIYCYISLFIGKEHMTKIQGKLREKVKIKIDNYDEEIKGNLTLYQSEEEALKLFPDFRHKEKPKEEDNKVKEQRVEKEEEK